MCGIVGVVGKADAAPLLLEALRRLEYRGYDSAGIATLVEGHDRAPPRRGQARQPGRGAGTRPAERHHRHRPYPLGDAWRADRAQRPSAQHQRASASCTTASSRTMPSCGPSWRPRARSSRPRPTPRPSFACSTTCWRGGLEPQAAFSAALKRVHGAFALAAVFAGHPKLLIGGPAGRAAGDRLRRGRDVRRLRRAGAGPADPPHRLSGGGRLGGAGHATAPPSSMRRDHAVERKVVVTAVSGAAVGKGNYRHFMEKELHEHPAVLGDTLRQYLDPKTLEVRLPTAALRPGQGAAPDHLRPAAAPSSPAWSAATGSSSWRGCRSMPTSPSEFRYRNPPLAEGGRRHPGLASPARRRIPWRRCSCCRRAGRRCCPSSTCRNPRWRGRATVRC